jgi:hypothetical protein
MRLTISDSCIVFRRSCDPFTAEYLYTIIIFKSSKFVYYRSLIAFVYTRIYLVVRKLAQSQNKSHGAVSKGNLTRMKLFLREIKQAKSCFIVVICFCVLGFLPPTIAVPFFQASTNLKS